MGIGGTKLDTLWTELALDSRSFDTGMKNAEGKFASLEGVAKGVGGVLAAVATTMAAVGSAAAVITKQTADQGDKFDKLSQRIGISVENLSGYEHVANLAGTSLASMTVGVRRLSANIMDMDKGMGEAKDTFEDLDIKVRKTDGSLKNADEILIEVGDRFSKMEDGAEKTAYAMDLFGRSGADLIPVFNQGSEGIREMLEEGESLRGWTEEEAKQAAELNDNLTRVGTAITGTKDKIGKELIPTANVITKEIFNWMKANQELIDNTLSKIPMVITDYIIPSVFTFLEVLNELKAGAEFVWETLKFGVNEFATAYVMEFELIKDIGGEVWKALNIGFMEFIKTMIDGLDKIIGGFGMITKFIPGLNDVTKEWGETTGGWLETTNKLLDEQKKDYVGIGAVIVENTAIAEEQLKENYELYKKNSKKIFEDSKENNKKLEKLQDNLLVKVKDTNIKIERDTKKTNKNILKDTGKTNKEKIKIIDEMYKDIGIISAEQYQDELERIDNHTKELKSAGANEIEIAQWKAAQITAADEKRFGKLSDLEQQRIKEIDEAYAWELDVQTDRDKMIDESTRNFEENQKQKKSAHDSFIAGVQGASENYFDELITAYQETGDAAGSAKEVGKQFLNEAAGSAAKNAMGEAVKGVIGLMGSWIGLGGSIVGASEAEKTGSEEGEDSAFGTAIKAILKIGAYVLGAMGAVEGSIVASDKWFGHSQGGWLTNHPDGGFVNSGSGISDDVYLGSNPQGHHYGMGGEFVMNKNATARKRPILEYWNRKYSYAVGGGIPSWEKMADSITKGGTYAALDGYEKGSWAGMIKSLLAYIGGMLVTVFGAKVTTDSMADKWFGYGLGGGIGDIIAGGDNGLLGGSGSGLIDNRFWDSIWENATGQDLSGWKDQYLGKNLLNMLFEKNRASVQEVSEDLVEPHRYIPRTDLVDVLKQTWKDIDWKDLLGFYDVPEFHNGGVITKKGMKPLKSNERYFSGIGEVGEVMVNPRTGAGIIQENHFHIKTILDKSNAPIYVKKYVAPELDRIRTSQGKKVLYTRR